MMDIETAIYCLRESYDEVNCKECPAYNNRQGLSGSPCWDQAKEISIDALAKQIPFKIKEEKWTDTKCRCGHVFSRHLGDGYHDIPYQNKTAYCPECGQKLDWTGGILK